jgi:hypothetical protein
MRGATKIVRGFEERHHPERRLDARLLLQQCDRQHVRCLLRHRDDVGAERLGMNACDRREGIEHVAHVRRRVEPGGHERPWVIELTNEKLEPLILVPVGVRSETQRLRDCVERLGVPPRLLANIEPRQHDAEGVDAPKECR